MTAKVPHAPRRLAEQATAFVQELRHAELYKQAGVSETLDWVAALVALDKTELDPAVVDETLGILIKNQEDMQEVRGEKGERLAELVGKARGGLVTPSVLFRNLIRFGRLLHAAGLDVPAGRMIDVASALDHIDIGRRSDFYYSLRTLLVHRRQDLPIFDEMFRAFWREPRHRPPGDLRAMGRQRSLGRPEVVLTGTVPKEAAGEGAAERRCPRGTDHRDELQRTGCPEGERLRRVHRRRAAGGAPDRVGDEVGSGPAPDVAPQAEGRARA